MSGEESHTEYFTELSRVHEMSIGDSVDFIAILRGLTKYVDNEFYGMMRIHHLTSTHPSVLRKRQYNPNSRDELERRIVVFAEQYPQYPDVVKLTQQGLEIAQRIVESVRELSNGEEPEQFYNDNYKSVKDFIVGIQQASHEISSWYIQTAMARTN